MKVTKTNGDGTVKFVCPSCGGHGLNEILINAHVETPVMFKVDSNRNNKMRMYYGASKCIEGDIDCYSCSDCGFIPSYEDGSPVCNEDELTEWLNNPVAIEEQINSMKDEQLPWHD